MAAVFRKFMNSKTFLKTLKVVQYTSNYNKVALNAVRSIYSLNNKNDIRILDSGRYNTLYHPFAFPLGNQRHIWGWLNSIFNKVDENRIKEVGSDRACAEWLLRCGAFVKWKNRDAWTKDYNSLPAGGGRSGLKIEEVDATDSAIMYIGFPHFRGCKHIRRIIFHKANYLDDAGMASLPLLKNSLKELQVSSCGNITVDGLKQIKRLINLEYLLLYDLPEIKDRETMMKELQESLPNCTVVFPYAQPEDDPNLKKEGEAD